ncbi:hypothetical protein JCM16418A_01470 [Paenibacillus pini]|uniref:Phosphotransbutyrylase n=1 Tax=Paenibacillus pini JCM 16418 TaxID=1236976 RepID=W7YI09_9BACL|nr:phosphotransbutyrylase [Paenibacillus pini JCM 16418]
MQPWLQQHLPITAIEKHFASFEFYYGREKISMKDSGAAGLIEFLIRKLAHVVEYAILGGLLFQLLRKGLRFSVSISFFLALLFCVLYASSDEIHQLFTAGRNPKMADVYLDTAGACLGMSLVSLFSWIRSRKRGKAIE